MSNSTRIDRRLHALALAKDCATLGARIRTIHHITGLSTRELLRLLFTEKDQPPRGRAPDTREWYHSANLLCRTEASVIFSNFRRLRGLEFAAGEALVCAYRYYRSVYQPPQRISFDRAFDLASHLDGIWIAKTPGFSLSACSNCGSEFLDACGAAVTNPSQCPFCRLVCRVERDPRVKASFPAPPLVDRDMALTLMRQLDPEQADYLLAVDSAAARSHAASKAAAGADTPLKSEPFPRADS